MPTDPPVPHEPAPATLATRIRGLKRPHAPPGSCASYDESGSKYVWNDAIEAAARLAAKDAARVRDSGEGTYYCREAAALAERVAELELSLEDAKYALKHVRLDDRACAVIRRELAGIPGGAGPILAEALVRAIEKEHQTDEREAT